MEEVKQTDSPPGEEVDGVADEPTEITAPLGALLEVGNICYLHPGRTPKPLLGENGALAPQHPDKSDPYESRNPPCWWTADKANPNAVEVLLEEHDDASRADITIRIPKDLRRTFVRGSVFAVWIHVREYGQLTLENFSSATVQVGNRRHCNEQPAKILLDSGEHVLFFHGRGLQLQVKLKFQRCDPQSEDERGWQTPNQPVKALTTKNSTELRLIESAGEEFDANHYNDRLQKAKEVNGMQQRIGQSQRKAPGPIAQLLSWLGLGRDYDEFEDGESIEAMDRHVDGNWMSGNEAVMPAPLAQPIIDVLPEPAYLKATPPQTHNGNGNGNGHHNGVTPPTSDLEKFFQQLGE